MLLVLGMYMLEIAKAAASAASMTRSSAPSPPTSCQTAVSRFGLGIGVLVFEVCIFFDTAPSRLWNISRAACYSIISNCSKLIITNISPESPSPLPLPPRPATPNSSTSASRTRTPTHTLASSAPMLSTSTFRHFLELFQRRY
jgi:hypothetical protein